MFKSHPFFTAAVLGISLSGLSACGGSSTTPSTTTNTSNDNSTGPRFSESVQSTPGQCPTSNVSITLCDPSAGTFSSISTHPFFPFAVGNQWIMSEDDEGTTVRLEIAVLDQTEMVNGVETRAIQTDEFEDDELIERATQYYAQAPDGSVCFFGEDALVADDNGDLVEDESWRAGEDSNLASLQMPASADLGQTFYQEFAPGISEALGEVVALGDSITTQAGTYTDTLSLLATDPLDDCADVENKDYARGIGLIYDDGMALVSFQ
ncbi:MAG: hypothetical protein ACSHXK_16315 [Oceanococcus sp.]